MEDIRTDWQGFRERKAVSYFAFKSLLSQVRSGTLLRDPAQITLEVAVPQIDLVDYVYVYGKSPEGEPKSQVTKDLVIWPNPGQYCWSMEGEPVYAPLLIMGVV